MQEDERATPAVHKSHDTVLLVTKPIKTDMYISVLVLYGCSMWSGSRTAARPDRRLPLLCPLRQRMNNKARLAGARVLLLSVAVGETVSRSAARALEP